MHFCVCPVVSCIEQKLIPYESYATTIPFFYWLVCLRQLRRLICTYWSATSIGQLTYMSQIGTNRRDSCEVAAVVSSRSMLKLHTFSDYFSGSERANSIICKFCDISNTLEAIRLAHVVILSASHPNAQKNHNFLLWVTASISSCILYHSHSARQISIYYVYLYDIWCMLDSCSRCLLLDIQ